MKIIEALAKESTKDFRLGDFMKALGLDASQPITYHRALIAEARQVVALQQELAQERKARGEAETKVANLEAQLREARNVVAQWEAWGKEAGKENAALTEKAEICDGMTALLDGRWDRESLYSLFRLVADLNERACRRVIAQAYGKAASPEVTVPPQVKARVRELLCGKALDTLAGAPLQCPRCGAMFKLRRAALECLFDF